jgi:hypothetical protein
MIEIVCYMGGTCGDLITALIDRQHVKFNRITRAVIHHSDRTKLKKPNLFANDLEKDQYVQDMGLIYRSVPSHDIEYHIHRQHCFIGITVSNFDVAMWAAKRFKKVHRPHVWDEMQRACGAESVNDYAQMMIDYSGLIKKSTDRLITLESIRQGQAVDDLEKLSGHSVDSGTRNLYNNWLTLQNGLWMI